MGTCRFSICWRWSRAPFGEEREAKRLDRRCAGADVAPGRVYSERAEARVESEVSASMR
jgi:hypothetical protein